MTTAIEWLRAVKVRPIIELPEEPEELAELLARVDTPGGAAEVLTAIYLDVARRHQVIVRLPWHFVTRDTRWETFRFWWLDGKRAFALKLDTGQVAEFAEIFRVEELLRRMKRPTKAVGYGTGLVVADFRPGEEFLDLKSVLFRVAKENQTEKYISVWRDAGTLDALRGWPSLPPRLSRCPRRTRSGSSGGRGDRSGRSKVEIKSETARPGLSPPKETWK